MSRFNDYHCILHEFPDAFVCHKVIAVDQETPPEYEFIEANPEFEKLAGLERAAMVGRQGSEVHPDAKGSIFDWDSIYGQVLGNGKAVCSERFYALKECWYDVLAFSIKPGYVAAVYRDITKQKASNNKITKDLKIYKELFENAPVGYQSLDDDGNFLMVNEAWLNTLGYKREEVLGKWFGDFLAPEYVEAFRERFPYFKSAGKIQSEFEMLHKNRQRRHIAFSGRIGYKADGSFDRTHCAFQDITEKKEVENIIKQHEEELLAIYENAPLIMMLVDSKRIVQKVNSYAALFTNKTAEDMIGKRTGVALGCYYAQEEIVGGGEGMYCLNCNVREMIHDTMASGQSHHRVEVSLPFLIDGKKESMFFILSTIKLLLNEKQYALVSLQDVTTLKNAEERARKLNEELEERVKERTARLEMANRELNTFSYSVSHDLRGPLNRISGFSKALLEDYSEQLDSQGQDYLQRIVTAGEQMDALIDDLLKLSRISSTEICKEPVELSVLANIYLQELQAKEPDRVVEILVEPNLVVNGDTALLRVALQNLLDNAWKYTSKVDKAKIEFGVTEIAGSEVFYIKDNGTGFNMKHADRLFTPFQRLHSADDYPGTGIGLSIVKRIVDCHAGMIWANSSQSNGACFYFTLPK